MTELATTKKIRVLLVEDRATDAETVLRELRRAGFDPDWHRVQTKEEFLAHLDPSIDLILADYHLPRFDAPKALRLLQDSGLDIPFIIVSGTVGEEAAVAAMKQGADDYLLKDRLARLGPAIQNALETQDAQRQQKQVEAALRASEKRFQALFVSSRDAIMTLEPPAWRFASGNPATVKMFGAKNEQELISHGPAELSPERQPDGRASAEQAREMIETALREGFLFFEWTHRRISGEEFPADVLLTRMVQGEKVMLQATVRDITERKRAEAALAQERNQLRTLIDNLPSAIYIKDTQGHYLITNRAKTRLLGVHYSEEVLGKSVFDFFPTEIARLYEGDDRSVVQTGQPVIDREEPYECDGNHGWLLTTKVPLRDAHGQIVGLVGITHDITERKRTEKRLQLQGAALEATANTIILTDSQGTIEWVNQAFTKLTGYTFEEAVGKNPRILKSGQQDRAFYENLWDTILRGEVWRGEMVNRKRDQSLYTVEATITPIKDERGEISHFIAVTQNITGRKQAEAELRFRNAILATQQEVSIDGILVVDENAKIVSYNRRFVDLWGLPPELVARGEDAPVLEFVTDQLADAEAFIHRVRYLYEHRQETSREEILLKDGRVFDRYSVPMNGTDGRYYGRLWNFRDITERKQNEERQLRAQRMEAIGALAGGIAHDLNNILSPIMMSVEVLKDKVADAEGGAILGLLETSAARGSALARQVLDFGRGLAIQRTEVNPVHLVREMQKLIKGTFPKNVTFAFKHPGDLWTVTSDPTQLHQVLMNLCVNARDAMPKGGKLTVTLENRVLDEVYSGMNPESKPGAYVLVKVADTGTGIPRAIQARIFEPFFTTKEVGKGTGLGLSTTLAIVRSHGGFIHLASELGQGTTFEVYLPATSTALAAESVAAEAAQLHRGNGELVLVVDDEMIIRTIARRTLERHEYRVLLAAHGAEALAHYAQHRGEIAVVLTDMDMPIMDGPATIIALRSVNPEVKIITSSGHPPGAGRERFLPKPYTSETMLKALAEVLRKDTGRVEHET